MTVFSDDKKAGRNLTVTRLEIGAAARSAPPLHAHSKSNPPPPTVVVHDWAGPPRPLPFLPSSLPESSAAPSGPPNAVAGPSKHPNALALPPSKVLVSHPPLSSHRQKSPSYSNRYQPLVSPVSSSFEPSATTKYIPSQNPIRPLPPLPPSSSSTGSATSSLFTPPPPPPPRRTRTSSSPSSGYASAPASYPAPHPHTPNHTRSALEGIPSSWASRPVDLNSSRPNSPPISITKVHHYRRPVPKPPRSRSHSRTRREWSLVSPSVLLGSGRVLTLVDSPPSLSSSQPAAGRMTGARPLTKKPFSQPQERKMSLKIRTSTLAPSSSSSSSNVMVTKSNVNAIEKVKVKEEPTCTSTTTTSDTVHLDSPLEFFVDGPETNLSYSNRSPSPIRYARPSRDGCSEYDFGEEYSDDEDDERGRKGCDSDANVCFGDGEMSDDDALLREGAGGIGGFPRGGVNASRSRGDPHSVRKKRRRRTQLRAYRMSYRPRDVGVEVDDPFRGMNPVVVMDDKTPTPTAMSMSTPTYLPTPSVQLAFPSKKTKDKKTKGKDKEKKDKEKEKKKDKWSFSDFTSSMVSVSAPGTRASSPERKGRMRRPGRLADAVSMALGGGGSASMSRVAPKLLKQQQPPPPPPPPIVLSATSSCDSGVYDFEGEVLDICVMEKLSIGGNGDGDQTGTGMSTTVVDDGYEDGDSMYVMSDSDTCPSSSLLPLWISSSMTAMRTGVDKIEGAGIIEEGHGNEKGMCVAVAVANDEGQERRRETSRNSPIIFSPVVEGRHRHRKLHHHHGQSDLSELESVDKDDDGDRVGVEDEQEREEIPFMWLSMEKPPAKPMPLIPPPPPSFANRGRGRPRSKSYDQSQHRHCRVDSLDGSGPGSGSDLREGEGVAAAAAVDPR